MTEQNGAQAHKSFVLYTDWFNHIKYLSVEECGVLLTAILRFAATRERSELDGAVGLAFSVIADQIERDGERWEQVRKKRSEAGRRSAEKRMALPCRSDGGGDEVPDSLDDLFGPDSPIAKRNNGSA